MIRTLLAVLLLPAAAHAATLRPMTSLSGPMVRVADLFEDAGPAAARVLGSAPAAGSRIVIEAPQLAAIARQFGVDWRPAGPSDRVLLDRPGRILPRDAVLATLRAALAATGADDDGEIELPGFAAPMVPLDAHPVLAIEQFDLDSASGRFTALLAASGEGMAPLRQRLEGTLVAMTEVPVAARRLLPGVTLRPGDLQMARIRASAAAGAAGGEVVRDPAQVAGLAPRRAVAASQPLRLAELARPMVVAKGARVAMQLLAPGLQLLAQGQALEAGAMGERIQVLNTASRAVLEAEVVGPDRVRVEQGSVPLLADGAPRLSLLQAGPAR